MKKWIILLLALTPYTICFAQDDPVYCASEDCWVTGFGAAERSLWLPDLPFGLDTEFEFDENGGFFETFPDGRAHLYGQCIHMDDPNYGFYADFWFTDKMNWEEWSALGRGWKGNENIVGDLYETWDYYIMDESEENTLTGTGGFEGSILYCSHRPADYYYGLQVGVAANDKNGEPGMSFWFNIEGQINGEDFDGHGDFNLEGECVEVEVLECVADVEVECIDGDYTPEVTGTPIILCVETYTLNYSDQVLEEGCPTVIERTWTATAEDGNTAICTHTITLTDNEAPELTLESTVIPSCDPEAFLETAVVDNCDPNPTVNIEILDQSSVSGEDCDPGQLRTQTMGGWGTDPSGNNPGVYLDANFAQAFPNGLTIGCDNTLSLTSAQAVRDFLPSGSTASVLPEGALVDPGQNYTNVLAGQLVAATLSVHFDAYDSSFGPSDFSLGATELQSGDFAGMTVAEVLEIGNEIIGGCSNAYDPSAVNNALSGINENYVDGTTNNGFLGCESEFDCAVAFDVLITASDACGNTATLETTVYWEDISDPVILEAPENITVDCANIPDPVIEVEDDCGNFGLTIDVNDEDFSGACLPTIQRTFTVTDPCGNSVQHIQYITVLDSTAPVIANEPSDLVIECGEEIPFFDPEVSDDCSEVTVELIEETTPIDCGFNTIQQWIAMDACGNTTSVYRQVIQLDSAGPVPTNAVEDLTLECDQVLELGNIEFMDECGEVIAVNMSEEQIGEGCEYTLVRSWEAYDSCGNLTVVSQTLTVIDTTAPVFTNVPEDVTVECGQDLSEDDAIAVDACSEVTTVYEETFVDGEGNCGQMICTWTATDACGNSASASRTVTFLDSEPPVFSTIPESGNASCEEFTEAPMVTAIDNCEGEVPVVLDETIEQEACIITLTRVWTATDLCGNVATAEQTLTFEDTQMPSISGDASIAVECNQLDGTVLVDVEDDCPQALEVSFEDVLLDSDASGCNRLVERTWFALDACGNEASFVQTLEITDTSAPVFVAVPEDMDIPCGEVPEMLSPEVYDICSDVMLDVTEEQTGNSCGDVLVRTWTAVDGCGNESSATQTITFVDTEAPVFASIPEDLSLDCNAPVPPAETVTASDNCSEATVTLIESVVDGNCAASYTILRTYTAEDACGNTATAVQTIQVADTTPPVFDFLPEDFSADCGTVPEPPVLTATDDCSEVTVSFEETFDAGGCPNIYRTWTATDACGNSTAFIQTVFIDDVEPPVLTGIPPNTEASCNSIPPMPEPEASDNCDQEVSVTVNESIIGSGCEFTILRTWIASDDCGNTTIVSQSINVIDTEAPVFIDVPDEVTIECSDLDGYPLPNVTDDCGSNVLIDFVDILVEDGCEKIIDRVYTATDPCGNTTQAIQTIRILDQTPPMISGVGPNQFVECDQVPDPDDAIVTDACGGVASLEVNETVISQDDCGYILDRTYIAVDDCGNTSALTQLIYVNDTQAPLFIGVPNNQSLSCGEAFPEPPSVGAIDNCSATVDVNFASLTESSSCGEVITWIWTAVDECGNQSSVTRTVERIDTTAPMLIGVPEDELVSCDNIPEVVLPAAMDECSDSVDVTMEVDTIIGGCPYEIRRTFIATDGCGNQSFAEQSIFVEDNDAPVFTEMLSGGEYPCDALPEAVAPEAIDNCSGVEVLLEEVWGEPGCVQTLERTWTAVDLCGNTAVQTETFTLVDTTPPVFTSTPDDIVVNCLQVPAMVQLEAADACSDVTLEMSEVTEETDCITEYTLTRMWTATDACGLSTSAVQTIEVIDDIAPILVNVPEDVSVTCEEIPEVAEVVALESCGETVEVTFEENIVLLEEEEDGCTAGNAVAFNTEIALWLPQVAGLGSDYVFGPEGGNFNYDEASGQATITGEVFNTLHAEHSWIIQIELGEARDWAEWSALGRSYKDDLGIATEFYQDWTYFILNGSTSSLTGTGALEGSYLELTHAPADSTFGFQLGMNANNRSEGEGLGGWFFYNGLVNGMPANGHGDVFLELNCCPQQEIQRTWTAVDCAGNVATYTQVITVGDETPSPMFLDVSGDEVTEMDVSNSTGDEFVINLSPTYTGYGDLRMFDAKGNEAKIILQQKVTKNAAYTLRVSKQGLSPGVYVFVFKGNYQQVSDQEMVLR